MYAVIFKAKLKHLDQEYYESAARIRELAKTNYGCLEFVSVCEGDNEISISYWESEEQVRRWKQDDEHMKAQAKGKSIWYESYSVQVTEIKRAYSHDTKSSD